MTNRRHENMRTNYNRYGVDVTVLGVEVVDQIYGGSLFVPRDEMESAEPVDCDL